MTTISQIITDSLRESGILAVGEAPEAEQQEEALRRLRSLFRSLFGNELGEKLSSVNYGIGGLTNSFAIAEDLSSDIEGAYIPANLRLFFNASEAATLYLHPNPEDGARLAIKDNAGNFASYNIVLNGNGRRIESASSVTLSTNSLNREWFFRADLGEWVRVTDLELTDQSPFPEEFDDLLITLLAFRLNPRYGAETDANLAETRAEMKKKFRARYRQTNEQYVDDGIVLLSAYPYRFALNFDFNRG